ncbi:MAG: hypothetical protein Q7R62_03565, partial [bacterium]|nr:hypothetical protein [bacterium]
GQSLVELVIGIALGVMFITGSIGIVVLTLRIGSQNKFSQTATELTHEFANQIPTVAAADWHNLFDISPRGTSTPYHFTPAAGFLTVASGTETVTINGQPYTRSFTVSDVFRDTDGALVTDGSGTIDPSTLAVTVTTSWIQNGEATQIDFTQYITRNRSRVFNQIDWVSGPGDNGPNSSPTAGFSSEVNINYASIAGAIYIDNFATTEATTTNNIDPTNKWAWNDVIGWIDFNITGNVTVTSSTITGYASSGVGYIALDCATSPSPSCTPSSYGVSNDGTGVLSGYAWNDAIGWIKFKSTSGPSYGVTVSSSTGDFSGWAWNDVVGWFSFNCADLSTCGTANYKTQTFWNNTVSIGTLVSAIFDTQVVGGAGFNTIMWQGTQPTGTAVKFQIAASNNASGPWNYFGPDGTASTYYQPAGPDVQTKFIRAVHDNNRYVRYQVTLESNIEKTYSPLVSNIIIGWSL